MSTGHRIPIDRALQLAEWLYGKWKLDPDLVTVVGSVRRGREHVGDLEFVAPIGDPRNDPLCGRMLCTMEGFVPDSIYGEQPEGVIGRAVKGLKPGFKAASVLIRTRTAGDFPVQVYRFTPDNRGWITLMRTGPGDFGEWFLGRWKDRMGIPRGDPKRQGSIDGHLVDAQGVIVPVQSEEEAFERCGLKPVHPESRDEFMVHIQRTEAFR